MYDPPIEIPGQSEAEMREDEERRAMTQPAPVPNPADEREPNMNQQLKIASTRLLQLIVDVGTETRWRDGPQTDRVFAWFEFDELREALGIHDLSTNPPDASGQYAEKRRAGKYPAAPEEGSSQTVAIIHEHRADSLKQHLAEANATIAATTAKLPETYYADRDLSFRVGMIVDQWRRQFAVIEQQEGTIKIAEATLAHERQLAAERQAVADATIAALRAEVEAESQANKLLADEVERLKASYHELDRNWHAIHEGAMKPIRAAIGNPDASVPEIVEAIGAAHRWVAIAERKPVEGDADSHGHVFWIDQKLYGHTLPWDWSERDVFTHWMPIPALPTAPESVPEMDGRRPTLDMRKLVKVDPKELKQPKPKRLRLVIVRNL